MALALEEPRSQHDLLSPQGERIKVRGSLFLEVIYL
jgi:hypothetical protein